MKIKKNTRYLIETKEDLQDFLERCEKKGWKWKRQESPLDFMPYEIPCVMIYDAEFPREGLAWSFRTDWYDKIYKRKAPSTLAEFLGWEEDVEYGDEEGALFMIIDGGLHYKPEVRCRSWNPYPMSLRDDEFGRLRKFKKNPPKPKLYYAKIKGWELVASGGKYFGHSKNDGDLFVFNKHGYRTMENIHTMPEWNALGVNDTNADFEEVAE